MKHIVTNNIKIRDQFRGSKYVQSDMNKIYEEILQRLKKNEKVLFTGTPCQVAGVQQFMSTSKTCDDNLILCDVVCHGSPSPHVWESYINEIEKKYSSKIKRYLFRDKEVGWRGYHIKVEFDDGRIIGDTKLLRSYVQLFSMDLMNRPSCYYCPYSSMQRVGDMTIGDFWGIEKIDSEFSDNFGISMVLCNTKKGYDLFQQVTENGELATRKYHSSVLKQPNLHKSTDFGFYYNKFWTVYKQKGYLGVAQKFGDYGLFSKIYYYIRAVRSKLR